MICAIQNKNRAIPATVAAVPGLLQRNVVALHARPHLNALLNKILPPPGPQLDTETRAKLLATVHRVSPTAIISSVALPALTAWAFWSEANHIALLIWCAIMLLLTAGGSWFYLGYQRDSGKMSRSAHTRKWWNNMRAIAFLTGLTWEAPPCCICIPGRWCFRACCTC